MLATLLTLALLALAQDDPVPGPAEVHVTGRLLERTLPVHGQHPRTNPADEVWVKITSSAGRHLAEVETGEDGRFGCRYRLNDVGILRIRVPGFLPIERRVFESADLNLFLEPAAPVAVTLVDQDGEPITNENYTVDVLELGEVVKGGEGAGRAEWADRDPTRPRTPQQRGPGRSAGGVCETAGEHLAAGEKPGTGVARRRP